VYSQDIGFHLTILAIRCLKNFRSLWCLSIAKEAEKKSQKRLGQYRGKNCNCNQHLYHYMYTCRCSAMSAYEVVVVVSPAVTGALRDGGHRTKLLALVNSVGGNWLVGEDWRPRHLFSPVLGAAACSPAATGTRRSGKWRRAGMRARPRTRTRPRVGGVLGEQGTRDLRAVQRHRSGLGEFTPTPLFLRGELLNISHLHERVRSRVFPSCEEKRRVGPYSPLYPPSVKVGIEKSQA